VAIRNIELTHGLTHNLGGPGSVSAVAVLSRP